MRKMGAQTEATRLTTLVDATGPAMKKCQCKPSADRVASILWKLAFENMGTLVAVTAKDLAALPWGWREGDVGRGRTGDREGTRALDLLAS
jgi:hypothetical protein